MYKRFIFITVIGIVFMACGKNGSSPQTKAVAAKKAIEIPEFNADSAYAYTAAQVAFGPRVPNTKAHETCGNYLSAKLKEFGAQVFEQDMDLETYNGIRLKAKNIIGSFQPENKNRVLLFAHWDTRPFSDQDADPKNYHTPIDGANDGAGSCAALLEIARQIGQKQPAIGIDIIFFDAEDWGVPSFDTTAGSASGYCLGSDFWAKNPHKPNYTARYGILLDMVSAPDARFYKEHLSKQSAPHVIRKVWEAAQIIGYGQYFVDAGIGQIEDDHAHVIQGRKIPCIDIIHYEPNSDHGFGSYWHTQKDNMDQVSRETLKAVGQTVLYVIYNEE